MSQDGLDPTPYAAFLMRRLFRPCGEGVEAAVETEWPTDGDVWAWADDNAKVLELLSHPALWRQFPGETAAMLRFVGGMCDGPFIFRRIGAPRLERAEGDDRRATWLHSMMHVGTDLPAGCVMLGIRFHDGRTARNLYLTGNYVAFRHRDRYVTLDVEEAITDTACTLEDGRLVASHAGDLWFEAAGGRLRLGRITYTYRVAASSMLVQAEAALDLDPEIEVADVTLTIGHDNLSHGENNVHYGRIGVLGPDGALRCHMAAEPGAVVLPAEGARYYAMGQEEMHGFALAIHSRPHAPERLRELRVVQNQPGRLHWVVAAYDFQGKHRGARLSVAEDKLLTAGGFHAEAAAYERLMREAAAAPPGAWPRDLSISYDYGVEINAFAKAYAVLAAGEAEAPPGLAAELRSLCDRYLDVYREQFVEGFWRGENTVFSRQLAFVILAAATMLRATGEERYRRDLATLVEVMLQFEQPLRDPLAGPESGFLMGLRSSRDLHVDCHSAALLALVHAAPWLPEAPIPEAIERGLNAFALVTGSIEWLGEARKVDTLGLLWTDDGGHPRISHAFWNFHVGLTLRLFRALRDSPDERLRAIHAYHAERLAVFEPLLLRQVALATREHADGLEIRSSWLSSETNSETQPWVVLGRTGHPWD
ncbi:hypothetical protein [Paracraurococcus lichenis]|uniref:Heparinase n=1 Tax=Paracraurococcus lichenis TaxID=3064888 RepID=A0ABT9DUH4_9PROT|nr:hypothetical protein [Paracraurococcus sp. LOR1-02]MDO9707551.1 hypothetical protein [Paracraurococcus sp. LOR1-02]